MTHDTYYPSRADGLNKVFMSNQLILNSSFSRKDALPYRTNSYISYEKIAKEYSRSFFSKNTKSKYAQMYDAKGSFYSLIENLRHNTSNGLVHGEIIDSEDTYSERLFLEALLSYCKKTGVEVISKAKAYDVCFNHNIIEGNLIYNPTFRNTAKEFFIDSNFLPSNPDGYKGKCHVEFENDIPVLITDDETEYFHFGIPTGSMILSENIKGTGNIYIYAIKNNTPINHNNIDLDLLGTILIDSVDEKLYQCSFFIPDNLETEYEQLCEGLGEKIMGIKIVYSKGLSCSKISLQKK